MKFFIVGAQFDNKGAQSMLFNTIDQLRKQYPGCTIICACTEDIDTNVYNFEKIYFSDREKNITLKKRVIKNYVEAISKDIIKKIIGRYNNLFKYGQLKEELLDTDLIIDISGYNIGDKWDLKTHNSYLNNILLAKKFSIPMILMPQSFGPFNYKDNVKEELIERMQVLLRYPKVIFAREVEGYELLQKTFNLRNVLLSCDLVLQTSSIDIHNIFRQCPKLNVPEVATPNNVGIIPNSQCFTHGNNEKILKLYHVIIKNLLNTGKSIYIFRHSREDLSICREIYSMYSDEPNVHLLENDFNCFEYEQFLSNFEFIIASRYHAIIHAYKNYIPCVLLGWAIKYKSLANKFNQDKYAFDITVLDSDYSQIVEGVKNMARRYLKESEIIREIMDNIHSNSCFSLFSENSLYQ